ncbi:MAG: nicotinate-nicotinamide nucleotide adenylyltransferase [Planctomycetota bacterium]
MASTREPIPMPIEVNSDTGVLLVGGTFDPPHVAHIELPRGARDARRPGAGLVFVPAGRSPHKAVGPVASDADRVAMLDYLLKGVEHAAVWTDEVDRADAGEPSYWVNTLERARSLVGGAWLGFVIGADQAVAFDRWREARRILELAEPVVLLREPWGSPEVLLDAMRDAWSDGELERWASWCVDVGTIDVSATEIRALLRDDRENARLESVLSPGVLGFIRERGLYAADT